jgi:CHASE3 domain sensor protein
MRLLAFLGAVVAAAVGLVGAMSLWSSAGALQRADHNTAQVVRIQGIYADLVRADADATNSFLVGGIEDPAKRADYDASMDRVAKGIAAAAQAQPADSDALGVLNGKVQTYASTVEQARVTNRQGLPVGATYLSNASATLRADILPIVKGLVDANKARADIEFDAASRLLTLVLVGLGGLAVLVLVMVWLARRTHRYLNPSLFVGTMVVVAALAVGIVTLAGVGSQVQQVRNSDFAYTVKLADARTAAYDAKSNESLTLIARGSGSTYETAWQQQSNNLITSLASLDDPTENRLKAEWNDYVAAHGDIRKADDTGNWDAAVQAALATDEKSANAKFTTFTNDADKTLAKYGTDTQNSLLGPVGWVTVIGWLLLGLCVAAAVLVLRGMGQRIEEYR